MTKSLEDYLETIFILHKNNKIPRIKDISAIMNVKSSSVNNAINELIKLNYIKHEKYGYIELLPEGIEKGEYLLRRHNILKRFFVEVLGIEEEKSENEACLCEHILSDETIERISKKFFREEKNGWRY